VEGLGAALDLTEPEMMGLAFAYAMERRAS
jgi:hypothetical protein